MATKKELPSVKFSKLERKLKNEVLLEIRKFVGERKIKLEDFTDEANNELVGINKDDVFFDDGSFGAETYPLHELGLLDAIAILSIVEDL